MSGRRRRAMMQLDPHRPRHFWALVAIVVLTTIWLVCTVAMLYAEYRS